MNELFSLLTVILITSIIVGGILVALVLVLLALPQSRLRTVFRQIIGGICFLIALFAVLDLFNFVDLIPIVGEANIAAALVTAVLSGVGGLYLTMTGQRAGKLKGGKNEEIEMKRVQLEEED